MTRFALVALVTFAAAGCRALPSNEFLDPVPVDDPVALEQAAIIAEAKASMYDSLAQSASGRWARLIEGAQGAMDGLGAPAVLTGLIGAAGGVMIPTPGQRRRERLAKAEGEVSRQSRNQAEAAAPSSA